MRRSLQLSLFAVVLLGLIGGTLAFFVAQKSVTLTVDGQVRHVGTYADTVGRGAGRRGSRARRARRRCCPAAGDAVRDGDTVVLNRARPLELTVDGVSRQVYVTALSVDEALGQLGYRADDLVLSASRSERLPLDGMELTITTPKEIVARRRRPAARRHHDRRHRRRPARRAGHRAEPDRQDQPLPGPGAAEPHAAAGLPGAGQRGLRDRPRCRATRSRRPTPTPSWASARSPRPGVDGPEGHPLPRHRHRRRRDRPRGHRQRRHRRAGRPSRPPWAPSRRPAGRRRRDRRRAQLGRAGQVRVRRQPARGQPGRLLRAVPVLAEHLGAPSAAPATRSTPRPDEQTARAQMLYDRRPAPASGAAAATCFD